MQRRVRILSRVLVLGGGVFIVFVFCDLAPLVVPVCAAFLDLQLGACAACKSDFLKYICYKKYSRPWVTLNKKTFSPCNGVTLFYKLNLI
jgi:hypothetical protein